MADSGPHAPHWLQLSARRMGRRGGLGALRLLCPPSHKAGGRDLLLRLQLPSSLAGPGRLSAGGGRRDRTPELVCAKWWPPLHPGKGIHLPPLPQGLQAPVPPDIPPWGPPVSCRCHEGAPSLDTQNMAGRMSLVSHWVRDLNAPSFLVTKELAWTPPERPGKSAGYRGCIPRAGSLPRGPVSDTRHDSHGGSSSPPTARTNGKCAVATAATAGWAPSSRCAPPPGLPASPEHSVPTSACFWVI